MSKDAIDTDLVKTVAHLSRLELAQDELAGVAHKLSNILEAFAVVGSVNIDSAPELQHPRTREDLRMDEAKDCLGSALALREAPQQYNDHFRVPPVL